MILIMGVLAASIVGSVHCAAMCGGFVCLYAGTGAQRGMNLRAHIAYNTGRLVSYVTLGLVAGALGARLDQAGVVAHVERSAAIVAGILMVAWACSMIAATFGFRIGSSGVPDTVKRGLGGLLVTMREQPPTVRAAATGLLTTLLPCGWLYTFVVTAGGTGNPIAGSAVMTAFWIGTLPMMVGVGLGVGRLARPIARHLPLAGAIAVFTLGALSIAGKLRPIVMPNAAAIHASHADR
jgi:sulfite exporter TauE/SafE